MKKYVAPKGNICKQAARKSQKLEWKKNKFWKGSDSYEAFSLEEASEEFMDFCKQERVRSGLKVGVSEDSMITPC